MNIILETDTSLFRLINGLSGNFLIDQLMLLFSNSLVLVICFILIVIFAVTKRNFHLLRVLLVIAIAVAISDLISYQVIKQIVERLRPCYALESVKLIASRCGGNFGFPSNHAANAMAFATLLLFTFGRVIGFVAIALALIIGFSRIYLGVHYPLDVIGGFAVGIIVASVVIQVLKLNMFSKLSLRSKAGKQTEINSPAINLNKYYSKHNVEN